MRCTRGLNSSEYHVIMLLAIIAVLPARMILLVSHADPIGRALNLGCGRTK
jgi:hypothetical protein